MSPKPVTPAAQPAATPLPPAVQPADIADAYQQVFDLLKSAYWEASDIESKDLITGVSQAIGDILTQLDEDDIASNTQALLALQPKIKAVNTALTQIQQEVNTITRNISTAASITSAIAKVLSLVPSLFPA